MINSQIEKKRLTFSWLFPPDSGAELLSLAQPHSGHNVSQEEDVQFGGGEKQK